MQKVVRDGKVAVLYSPGHGAGWYTWDVPIEGLFHPELVEAVERKASSTEIKEIAKRLFGDGEYYGGARGLEVEWVTVGTQFRIEEYDGSESIYIQSDYTFITA